MLTAEVRVDVLAARARGETFRAIAGRLGLSKDTVQRIERDHGHRLIEELSGDLAVALAQQRLGYDPHWPWITIPFGQPAQDWADSLDLFSWACRRLRERGFDLEIITRPHPDGLDLMLTLPPQRRSS